jgi:hypothetical protein
MEKWKKAREEGWENVDNRWKTNVGKRLIRLPFS